MRRLLCLLRLSIWRNSLQCWSWRSFLITLVVGQAVTPLLGLFVWSAALPGSTAVSTYYVALLVVSLMTVSYEHHTLSNGIYAGTLGTVLLQPQPVVVDYLGQNIALRLWHIIFGIPLIVVASALTGVGFDPAEILIALPAVVIAAALRFVFTFTLALSALWTERAHGTVGFGETLIFLLGGSAAPVQFLPHPFRILGEALPFWSMLGMPAEIAAGTLSGAGLIRACAVQLGWLLVGIALACRVWRNGIRRFTALGG